MALEIRNPDTPPAGGQSNSDTQAPQQFPTPDNESSHPVAPSSDSLPTLSITELVSLFNKPIDQENEDDSTSAKDDSTSAKDDSTSAKDDSTSAKDDSTSAEDDNGLGAEIIEKLLLRIGQAIKPDGLSSDSSEMNSLPNIFDGLLRNDETSPKNESETYWNGLADFMMRRSENPRSLKLDGSGYSPDIDSGFYVNVQRHKRASYSIDSLENEARNHPIFVRHGYSFDGKRQIFQKYLPKDLDSAFPNAIEANDIEICNIDFDFSLITNFDQFTKICTRLDLAPCLEWQVSGKVYNGLSRRIFTRAGIDYPSQSSFKGKGAHQTDTQNCYDIWFLLPTVHSTPSIPGKPLKDEIITMLDQHSAILPALGLSMSKNTALFYMKHDMTSKKTVIVYSADYPKSSVERFINTCEMSTELDIRSDPFAFLCCALSDMIDVWSEQRQTHLTQFANSEKWMRSLANELGAKDIPRAKRIIQELHLLRPFQILRLNSLDCLMRIAKDVIEEHNLAREFLDIPYHTFFRVDKNLRTILSWTESMHADMESRVKVEDNHLSMLSQLFSLRHERAIDANTESMKNMAEISREDNYMMSQISRATKVDSEAMKTIAVVTMLYLPATFVATIFSMGIFNFDFDNGNNGTLAVSKAWWVYLVVSLLLTFGTFAVFQIVRRRQMQVDANADTKPAESS